MEGTTPDGALARLKAPEQAITDMLLPLLERVAESQAMRVCSVKVARFIDPEDDSEQVVLTQLVEAEPRAALDYWETLGAKIEDLIDSLPDKLRKVAINRIAVEVRWTEHG